MKYVMPRNQNIFVAALIILIFCLTSFGQATSFSYQGRFTDATVTQPTNGSYNMQFALFDAVSGGTQIGATATNVSVPVTSGVFTVSLDFGGGSFDGPPRFLETRVFNPATSAYVILNPRQVMTSVPYAIRSLNTLTADNALNVGGTPAANIIKEGDTRLTDSRTPSAGSTSYIQNQNAAAQTAANFQISGTGTANTFNATTQFNIAGSRAFSIGGGNTYAGFRSGAANPSGDNNSFFGRDTGFVNTSGVSNSFFGAFAGLANLGGSNNSFFGREAGVVNTSGNENSFFGVNAGRANTSGIQNVFLGVQAGAANTIGSNNTIVGTAANLNVNNLNFATAIGSGATVGASNTMVLGRSADAVQIPGSLTVTGTLTAALSGSGANITNLNASNIATGTLNNARLGTVPIASGGTGSATQNFVDLTTAQTVAGNKTFSETLSGNVVTATTTLSGNVVTATTTLSGNIVNTDTQYNVIGRRALQLDANSNLFGGDNNGQTTAGSNNTYFGVNTGGYFNHSPMGFNTTGSNNTLIGANATLGFPESNFRTAIGAGSRVNSDNTISLGRSDASDTVLVNGYLIANDILRVRALGAGPGVGACRNNTTGEISFCSSSLRYKTNIAPFASGLSLINKLRPVTFDWKTDGTHDLGFIAEEINAVEPLLTIYNDKGQVEGLKYDRLSVAFVNAFKEQQTQIEAQAKELAEQRLLIDGLKKLVCANRSNAVVCR